MKHLNFIVNRICANTPPCCSKRASRFVWVLVLMLTIGVGQMWGADPTATFTAADQGWTGTSTKTQTIDGITFSFAGGTTNPTYYEDNGLRTYENCVITISSSNTITGISFSYTIKNSGCLKSFNTGTWASGTKTWSGSATSINCTVGHSSGSSNGQVRITQIVVTYEGGCTGTKLGTPVVTAEASNQQVRLTWPAVSNASGYQLKWNGGDWAAATSPVTKTDLTNGTAYTYQVKAIGNGSTYCDGDASAAASATPNVYYTVTWNNNGAEYTTTQVVNGQKPVFPENPTSCDAGEGASTTFYGWTTSTWSGKKDDVSAYTIYTKASDMPAVTGNGVVYNAVFCKGSAATWDKVTSAPSDWSGEYVITNSGGANAMISDFYSGTSGEFKSASVTITGSQITSTPTDKMIWVVERKGATGDDASKYSFQNKSTGTYAEITGTSSTNAALNSNAVWFTIATSGTTGVWKVNSVTNSARCFAWCSSNSTFRTYANSSNTTGNLYKKNGGATSKYMTNCCTSLGSIKGSVNLTQTSATLTWADLDHVSSWAVQYKEHSAENWNTWNGAQSSANSKRSVTITGLTCGTAYDFRTIATPAANYCELDSIWNNGGTGHSTSKWNISYNLTNTVALSEGPAQGANACGDITASFTKDGLYTFPEEITVTIGGNAATVDVDYLWDDNKGELYIEAAKVTGDVVIMIAGVAPLNPIVTPSPSALSFAQVKKGAAVPAAQDIAITGHNLTDDLTVTSSDPTLYAVSVKSGSLTPDVNKDASPVITVTPQEGITSTAGDKNATITISGGGLAADVVVNVTFNVQETYTVNWYVNGNPTPARTQTDIVGTDLTEIPSDFSAATDCSDKTFMGWTETANYSDENDAPGDLITSTTGMKITAANKNYYAVFADKDGEDVSNYVKVTAAPATNWNGTYLFVRERSTNAGAVFNGTTADNNNYIVGTISNSTIASSNALTACEVTFIKHEGDNFYSLKTNANKYLSGTSGNNALLFQDEDNASFSISIASNKVTIVQDGFTADRGFQVFNQKGSGGTEPQFTDSVYTFKVYDRSAQQKFCLYKKNVTSATYSNYVTVCPHVSRVTLSAPEVSNGSISFAVNSEAVTSVRTDGGEDVEVDVVPDPATGYELTGVALSGIDGATYSDGVITIPANAEGTLTATATFAQKNYSITMEQRGGANATLSDNQTNKHYNDLIEISTTEPEGYEFGGWFIYDATDTEKENDLYESIFTGDYEEDYNKLTAHFYMPERNLVALAHFDKIYSVSELAALSKTNDTKYLVEGIVSSVQGYYSSKYITYFISVDGKNENTLKIYNGLDEGGEKFYASTDLKVGDKVRVYGAWSATNSCIDDSYLTLHTVGEHASYEIAGDLTQDVFVEGATFLDSYMANLKVNDVYNTGYKVEVDDVTFSANKTTLATTDETVRVTATKNASTLAERDFTISVSAATMVSFKLKEGYKTSYFVGQTFVKPTVVATLSDNSHVEAEATACTGYNMSAADTYDVTVSFTYGTTTLNNVQYQITVRTIANDLATAYTASEAKDIIENVYASTTESGYDVYVSGIAVGDPNNEGTYFISNDGSASNQVQIYKGKYFDSSVSAKDNVKAGDELVVKGHILVYSNAAEMKSTTVVSQVREGELDVDDVEEFEVGSDDLVAANLTINRHGSNGAITFSCNENSALEIVENGTKLRAKGTEIANVEVTATMAEVTTTGVINFTEATTTFNVHVVPVQTKYTISFDSNDADGGAAPTPIADKAAGANVTLPDNSWTKTGYNFDGWKVTYVDGDEVVHEVTITANAFTMPAYNVTIQAQWAEIPVWAYTYTSNVTVGAEAYTIKILKSGSTTEYNEFEGQRYGAGSTVGVASIYVPQGTQKLHFHAAGWNDEDITLSVKVNDVDYPNTFGVLVKEADISGSKTTYIIATPVDEYYCLDLSSYTITENSEIKFTATGGNRFVLFGVNQEGGVVPELDHIVVSGELTYKDYELGDNLNTAGLTVTAYYTLAGVAHHSEDVTSSVAWSYDPLTGDQTSVDVTATYEGKTNTLACEINAVVVPEPEIILSESELAFSGKQYSPVADKTFDVQLKNVGAATIALSGDDASKFSIDETGLTANGTITVSANTDAAGTFIATITVSDNAHDATSQTVALTLTVKSDEAQAPAWNAEWVEATELYDGMPILITGMKNDATYAMGAQGGNNRAAIEGSLSEGVFTPGAGTKQFTLEKQSDGTYAIKTSTGEYLYAASSSANHLQTQNSVDGNAKWTMSVTSAVANGNYTHKMMQFNSSSTLFACYTTNTTTQADIKLYTPKTYTRTISGNIGTICLPYRVEEGDYFGATFYRVMYKKGDPDAPNYVQLEEVGALEAGRPYIFVPDDRENTSVLRAVYRDKEAVANSAVNDTENHGLYGTFTQVVKDGTNEIIYILNNNTIRRCGTNCTVGANKAYIMMEEVPAENEQPASAPGRRQMSLLNGDARPVATGIEDVQSDVQCTKIFYDGQIYILRGDKMYDVTGKLVK